MLIEPGRLFVSITIDMLDFPATVGVSRLGPTKMPLEYVSFNEDMNEGMPDYAWMATSDWCVIPLRAEDYPYPDDFTRSIIEKRSLLSVNIDQISEEQVNYLTPGMSISIAHPRVAVDIIDMPAPETGKTYRIRTGPESILSPISISAIGLPALYSYYVGCIIARATVHKTYYFPSASRSLSAVSKNLRYPGIEEVDSELIEQVRIKLSEPKKVTKITNYAYSDYTFISTTTSTVGTFGGTYRAR